MVHSSLPIPAPYEAHDEERLGVALAVGESVGIDVDEGDALLVGVGDGGVLPLPLAEPLGDADCEASGERLGESLALGEGAAVGELLGDRHVSATARTRLLV